MFLNENKCTDAKISKNLHHGCKASVFVGIFCDHINFSYGKKLPISRNIYLYVKADSVISFMQEHYIRFSSGRIVNHAEITIL